MPHVSEHGSAKHITDEQIPGNTFTSAYAWYAAILLTLASTLSYIDRQIIALVIGPLRRDLNISDTEVSLLIGIAFASFYAVVTLPMAWLADRYSRRWLVAWGIFVWSVMTAASGLASKYSHLFVARMGVGVGEATLSPAAYSLLSDYFDKVRLPLAVGLFQSATFLGAGFAYFIGGPLVDYLEGVEDLALPLVGSVRSWHAVFFIVGLPGIILAVVVALTLIEPPRTGRLKRGAATQGSTLLEVRAFLAGRWQLFFWVCLGFMLMATQGFSLFAWSSEYLVRVHSLSRTQAGMAFGGIAVVIGVMGSLAGGVISSWLVARGYPDGMMRLALGKCLLSAPFAIAYGLAPSPELALGVLVPLVFLMSLTPGLGAAVVQAVAPNEMRGQIVAIYGVAVGFLSYVLAPLMVALVTDHVFGFDGAVGMSMALVGGIAYPAASVCLWLGLKHYRKALVAASAWDGSGAQAA